MQHPQEQNNLRHIREQLGLSQEDVAYKIGSHPKTVGRWERGLSTPNPYYRRRLAKHLGTSVQDLGFLPELERLSENDLQHDKLSQEEGKETLPSECFYGRERELEMLEQWIIREHAGVILVSGVGGVGKTSLVRALEKKICNSFSTIFWGPSPN
jgi:transcriptional regulator with XRE-family HTH domain